MANGHTDTLLYQLMQQNLAAVGVDVTLRLLPFPDLLRRIASGEWDDMDAYATTLSSAWFGDVSQAVERMSCDYPSTFFCEPQMTDLIEESNHEMNRDRRKELLQTLFARFHDIAPALLLVDYSAITGTSPRVSNYRARSNGILFEEIVLNDCPPSLASFGCQLFEHDTVAALSLLFASSAGIRSAVRRGAGTWRSGDDVLR